MIRGSLIITLTIILGGCSFGASIPQQLTSLNANCRTDDVKISNEVFDLNGEESWTAECEGKTYDCTYSPDSDTDCYEVNK